MRHHNFDPGVAAAAGGNLCRSRGSTEGEVGEYGEGTAAVMALSLGLFFFKSQVAIPEFSLVIFFLVMFIQLFEGIFCEPAGDPWRKG